MASEESRTNVEVFSISEEDLSDDMSKEDFAARVMDAVHEGILGRIMKSAVSRSMDVLLKKETTKLADDMMKFKKVLGNKMHEAKSLADGEPVWLTRMKESFEAGWEEWRSGLDNREELAYRAFIKVMTSRPE